MNKPPAPKPATEIPAIEAGDEVFFDHPEIGPHHGHVRSHGRDGCVVKDSDGKQHRVPWMAFLGFKGRANNHYKVVAQGESGAIMEGDKGARRFVAGWSPEDEREKSADPKEEASDKDLKDLRKRVHEATNPKKKKGNLAKSFAPDHPVILFLDDR